MQKFETKNLSEAMQCKRSQFFNKVIELPSAGSSVTGMVHSVMEAKNVCSTKWIVTFAPKPFPTDFPLKKIKVSRQDY
jgi:hypothetical protein